MNSSSNQTNSATRGGMGTVPTPANSGGSGIFGSTTVGATHGSDSSGSSDSPSSAGFRRPSQESSPMFGGLASLKRDSTNPDQTQRRSSLGEQAPQPGILGSMWKNYTKGNDNGQ
ncbi:MAG: hypothetical protein Q9159_001269 [Coniocarpon cinnabarinum]